MLPSSVTELVEVTECWEVDELEVVVDITITVVDGRTSFDELGELEGTVGVSVVKTDVSWLDKLAELEGSIGFSVVVTDVSTWLDEPVEPEGIRDVI